MSAIVSFLAHPWIIRLTRIAIGLVLLAAALAKIADVSTFAGHVHNFRLAPIEAENLVAMTLPWIELGAGLALVLGVRAREGAVVALVLMTVFTIGVGSAWARGLDFECGCFGTSGATRVGWPKLLENLGMLALGVVGVMPARAPAAATSNEP